MILHVIDSLLPEKGGPTSVVIELARHQALAGHRVAVLSNSASQSDAGREAVRRSWSGLDVSLIETPPGAVARARAVRDTVRSTRPSVVHLHCVWEGMLRAAAAAAQELGIPCVASTHGMLHPYAIAQKRWKKEAYLLAFRGHFRRISEHLALNVEEAEYIGSRFGWRSSVLYNGVELERYGLSDGSEFRSSVPALGDRPYALFVGRLHPIKGCDLLMRSFRLARERGLEMDLVLAGPDEGALSSLRSLAGELGVASHVHFPGGVFGSSKLAALAGCSMFVHRPRFEGFGIAVIEAMASARPVVTTARCHLEAAGAAGALIMAPDSDEGFAEAMLRVARRGDMAQELGSQGRAWARSHCGWQSIVDTATTAYRRAAS